MIHRSSWILQSIFKSLFPWSLRSSTNRMSRLPETWSKKKKKNSLSFVIRFFRVSWYFFYSFLFFFFSSSLYSFKTTQSVVYSHDNHTQRKTKNTVKLLEETQEKCTMIQICRQDETKRIKVKFKHMISFEFPANWMCSLKNCNYSWLLLDEFIIIYI